MAWQLGWGRGSSGGGATPKTMPRVDREYGDWARTTGLAASVKTVPWRMVSARPTKSLAKARLHISPPQVEGARRHRARPTKENGIGKRPEGGTAADGR